MFETIYKATMIGRSLTNFHANAIFLVIQKFTIIPSSVRINKKSLSLPKIIF